MTSFKPGCGAGTAYRCLAETCTYPNCSEWLRLLELAERLRGTKPHCNFGSDLCARDARDAGAAIDALLAQLEAATARIGVLKEALEPFAKDADDWYTPGVHYDDSLELWQTGRTSVTVGHLRAARSALNSHADGGRA